ncbi:MAG TPA: allophanate hydrolase [Mycobacteriales bacterium]|nr:allophanate hydrolase [Mycobacteriales bacterium]
MGFDGIGGEIVSGVDPARALEAVAAARAAGERPTWTRLFSDDEVRAQAGCAGDGALAGLPFAVKDNIDIVGIPTTGGWPGRSTPAATTATAVSRLMTAGAVPIGKTNLDQFATGLVGTRSPYGAVPAVGWPERISGGSSSGSAAAVAGGLVPLALGTDTAGSGRVPAGFNALVGMKPTRGLVSSTGVLPACRSLDCVTTLTRTVGEARAALDVLAAADPANPWSRARPPVLPSRIARQMRVVGVPSATLDLDPGYADAWARTAARASESLHVVPVDIEPFLAAARLLYDGPWVAERYAAVGGWLETDDAALDPTVRSIVLRGRELTAVDAFAGFERLRALTAAVEPLWDTIDALLLPTTPCHPTLAEVATDPVGVNARLGTYTNFVNLMDLCAIAVPGEDCEDGRPFGVQLIAPAFADGPLLDLAALWLGEPVPAPAALPAPGAGQVVVCGAHLSGMAMNRQLLDLGAQLVRRTRTGPGYRMYALPDRRRPGLVATGDGPPRGIDVEVWELSDAALGALLRSIAPPLGLGTVVLADGSGVTGFLAESHRLGDAADITAHGGWRQYLAAANR